MEVINEKGYPVHKKNIGGKLRWKLPKGKYYIKLDNPNIGFVISKDMNVVPLGWGVDGFWIEVLSPAITVEDITHILEVKYIDSTKSNSGSSGRRTTKKKRTSSEESDKSE